jgi:hypothetical protein
MLMGRASLGQEAPPARILNGFLAKQGMAGTGKVPRAPATLADALVGSASDQRQCTRTGTLGKPIIGAFATLNAARARIGRGTDHLFTGNPRAARRKPRG